MRFWFCQSFFDWTICGFCGCALGLPLFLKPQVIFMKTAASSTSSQLSWVHNVNSLGQLSQMEQICDRYTKPNKLVSQRWKCNSIG
jgi:hypothetical protein